VEDEYKPAEDPNIRGDAYKTLFVGRLSWETKTEDLEREFGRFGAIERVRTYHPTHQTYRCSKGFAYILG